MGKVKAIAEYKNKKKMIGVDDWEGARQALRSDKNTKDSATYFIDDQVHNSLSNIIEKVISEDKNIVFSPTALYLALIVLAEMTAGNTKKEILKSVGIDEKNTIEMYRAVKNLSEAMGGYADSTVSSSIWLNESVNSNNQLLERLMKRFQVSSYEGEMGTREMDESISKWINDTTGNMLAKDVKVKTTQDMLFDLFTTISFCSKWRHMFSDNKTRPGNFILEDGSNVRCKYLHELIETEFHEGKNYKAMTKRLLGDYDVVFVLPNEGVSVHDLVSDKEVMKLANECSINSTEKCEVTFSMPKFEISSNINLLDVMKNLDISDVFVPGVANFAPISSEDAVCLSKAEQTTRIKMDEEGVEAASCVEMGAVVAGISPEYRKVRFELNRPFLFFVVAHGTVPVFAGKVMDPRGE